MDRLKYVKTEKLSGAYPPDTGCIKTLKRNRYSVIDIFVSGDAPKEVIKVYDYEEGKISKFRNWSIYIAKTGHKWYPYESITEFLLNKLGECLGLEMAASQLVNAGGQIRFLSKYFLKKNQRLIHGADIFSGYIEDREFIEEIEEKKLAREMLSIQFAQEAISVLFPDHYEKIFKEFIRLLIFDAIVGNNDRHFYNWGIVRDIFLKEDPKFSPIYDTARGLYWNQSEQNIISLYNNVNSKSAFLSKYVNNSRPKIGWEGESNLNHFQLVKLIADNEFGISKNEVKFLISKESENKCLSYILQNCRGLFSKERETLIMECLQLRFRNLQKELNIKGGDIC